MSIYDRQPVGLVPDLRAGFPPTSGAYTVDTTASVAIPDGAEIVRLYTTASGVRYGLAAPAAEGSGAQAAGCFLVASQVETCIVGPGASRTLHLRSTSSASVLVEFR